MYGILAAQLTLTAIVGTVIVTVPAAHNFLLATPGLWIGLLVMCLLSEFFSCSGARMVWVESPAAGGGTGRALCCAVRVLSAAQACTLFLRHGHTRTSCAHPFAHLQP